MKRGDVVVVAAEGYAGKPRPAVVIQADDFSEMASVCVCLITTDVQDRPLVRIALSPSSTNGLREDCWIMVDKITTLPIRKIGRRIGHLPQLDMIRLDRALIVFLGLAS